MSRKIGNLFQAGSKNLSELSQAFDTGYRIPEYQRPYDWSDTNVKRLFTDCLRGFFRLGQGEGTSAYCFLGSLILVDERAKETTFSGRSVAVIDGQQRLTTLSLMACALHSKLFSLEVEQLQGLNTKVIKWLKQEQESFLIDLMGIALGAVHQRGGRMSFFPRIVRESTDDNRAIEPEDSKYNSPISKFLEEFAKSYSSQTLFECPVLPDTRAGTQVKSNFLMLREFIDNLNDEESYDDYDATIVPKEAFTLKQYTDLLPTLRDHFEDDDSKIEKALKSLSKNIEVADATRLLLFCNYFLSNVILTTITADDESLAFDMFDSLNTTGQPLTALETLKPIVISFENLKPKKYKGSVSKIYFEEIAEILDEPNLTTTQKQNITRDAITNAVLLTSGEKLGHETSAQRARLRSHFDKATAKNDVSARSYIKNIRNVILFRDAYWQSDYEKLGNYHTAKNLEQVKFLIAIIGGLKTHLALPILQRYWSPLIKKEDQTEFLEVIQAVVAFILLRRSFTGGTAGIDTELRKLMSTNLNTDSTKASAFLKTGIEESHRRPSSAELRAGLKASLKKGRHQFSTKEAWISRAASNPLYEQSGVLCRALHLLAADMCEADSKNPGHWLRKGIKSSANLKRANYATWMLETVKTVEHIAPQRMAKVGDWEDEIYKTPGLVNCLGNLTLLPVNLNAAIGNSGWVRKSKFFNAIACKKDEQQMQLFLEAKADGMEFKKKFVDLINAGEHLPLVVPISLSKTWSAKEIALRSENIAALAYERLDSWL